MDMRPDLRSEDFEYMVKDQTQVGMVHVVQGGFPLDPTF
jgi:hypothetical protein